MDTGKIWYITSNYLDGDFSSGITLKRQSDKVIEVTSEGRKFYLYASRIPNGSFNGAIVGDSTRQNASMGARRSMTGMGGMDIAISNLNDKANEIYTKTDNTGNFTATGTIPGDEYELTVDGQSTVVTPNTDGENIGTVTITAGVNFKTSIAPQNSNTDMMALYADNTSRDFTIRIANTGTDDYSAAVFELDFPAGLIPVSYPEDRALGTIEPGKEKTLPITVACAPIAEESEYKKIGITVTDKINYKTWNDSVSLKFNRTVATFYVTSNSEVAGVVIVPSARAYHFKTRSSNGLYAASVTVPRYAKDYLVVFSGATADTEVKYALGINTAADSNFTGFIELGNYEKNDTEAVATRLQPGDKIMSYLHKNDVDYYKVNLGAP
jgi:hypothetical protein